MQADNGLHDPLNVHMSHEGSPAAPSPFCSAAAEVVQAFEGVKTGSAAPCSEPERECTAQQQGPSAEGCNHPGCKDAALSFSSLPGFTSNLSILPSLLPSAQTSCGQQGAPCPPHGVKAVCGKRAKMEDAYAVQPNFFDLPLSPTDDVQNKLPTRIALQLEPCLGGSLSGESNSPSHSMPISPAGQGTLCSEREHSFGGSSHGSDTSNGDTLHFFGVYDGHGGCEAAHHCANRLHHHLSEALANASTTLLADPNGVHVCGRACQAEWTAITAGLTPGVDLMKTSCGSNGSAHTEMDLAYSDDSSNASASDAGSSGARSPDSVSINTLLEEALRNAFLKTDAEFAADGSASMVGSTAVVALLGTKKMWIANCGDSRAVLCRGGKAIQLTDDHKPEREDEAERVEKAGGQVLFWNGHRVMGVLAMSRAIGDHGLRPYVIPEPEITVVSRAEDDDFLLLASDGLWDVMANQEATNLAIRCLTRAWEKGASRKAAVRIAASVLTKAAIDRGSKDNVTVVIVDLKSLNGPAAAAAAGSGNTHEGDCTCDTECA